MPPTRTRTRTSARPDFWRDPALPFVESRQARDSRACYAAHTHATLSLGLIEGGHSLSRLDHHKHVLQRGHVVAIPAGLVHACNPREDACWSYRMLYLDPTWVAGVLAEANLPADKLDSPRVTLDVQAFFRLQQADRLLRQGEDAAGAEASLIACLLHLARHGTEAPIHAKPRLRGAALQDVLALLDARCHDKLPLAELARVARLSRAHLVRAFRDAMGMSPHAWQLDRRIERAKPLLRAGLPLAEVALQLGFADQSHFQRAFRQRVAATPLEYLRRR